MSFGRRRWRPSPEGEGGQAPYRGRAPGKASRAQKRFGWTGTEPAARVQRDGDSGTAGQAVEAPAQGHPGLADTEVQQSRPSGDGAASAPIQARTDQDASIIQDRSAERAAQVGAAVSSGGGPLPHREKIQTAFGRHDVSGVRAFVGGEAGQQAQTIGASAFATGDAVGFADSPSLHTAAHEAAHVVQQRAGVVALKGINPSASVHERHADAVADAVVAGRSAEPLLDAMPSRGGAAQEGAIQRHPHAATAPPQAANGMEAPRLDPEARVYVRVDAKNRLVRSQIAFYDAANTLKSAIEATAKRRAEFASLVIDVAIGTFLPGLGTGLAAIANALPTRSPTLLYKVALPLSDDTLARAMVQNATKTATTFLKSHASEILGATKSGRFLDDLKIHFAIGSDRIAQHLNLAPDAEVVAVWAAFDPSITNRDTYLVALSDLVARFQTQVEPIAEKSFDRDLNYDITRTTHAFYVTDETGKRQLAVLRQQDFAARSVTASSRTYFDFISWVSPDLRALVLERTKHAGGEPVDVPSNQIDNLEPYGAAP